jgi:penicillin amidase
MIGANFRRVLLAWTLPRGNESIELPGLAAPVTIVIDRSGVPHVEAQSAHDAFLAQGFLHARDRLWQMELNRRIARGELAELFGPIALPTDRVLRRLGFRRAAERDLAGVTARGRDVLDAYAAGVNAYVARHRRPIEFGLLRSRPHSWSAVDTLAFGRYMGWSQTENLPTEIVRRQLAGLIGTDRASELEPGDPAANVIALAGLAGGASNNWVASPARSVSGHALLANDPHLYPRIPPVWYMAHLRSADGLNVIGATLPGLPGVVIGHNSRIAWGVTAGMADCEDLVDQDGRAVEEAAVIQEEIKVKGKTSVIEEVRVTTDGPILNGALGIPVDGPAVALRSSLHEGKASIDALVALNRATDWAAFQEALEQWDFPCLNFVYADVDGNIGYRMAGRVPRRQDGKWAGTVPFAEMPVAFNPDEGIFVTANNRPTAPMRHELARDWIDDYRWTRIVQLLRLRPRHTVEDFQTMQQDLTSLAAQQVAARLARLAPGDGLVPDVLARLREWNGSLDATSPEAAIYQVFRIELVRALYRELGEETILRVLGRGPDPVIAPVTAFFFRGSSALLARLDNADESVVRSALLAALRFLRDRLGPDMDRWRWGDLHRISFRHPVGLGVPILDRLLQLSRGPYPIGGDADTVAQAGVDPWNPFSATAYSASYRQVFDTGDWDRGVFILPTGQSGHPASPHYADMVSAWRIGEYRPLPFSPQAVRDQAEETIQLTP